MSALFQWRAINNGVNPSASGLLGDSPKVKRSSTILGRFSLAATVYGPFPPKSNKGVFCRKG